MESQNYLKNELVSYSDGDLNNKLLVGYSDGGPNNEVKVCYSNSACHPLLF